MQYGLLVSSQDATITRVKEQTLNYPTFNKEADT